MGILDLFSLEGKTSYVTGGARGIGRSIAFGLAEAGAKVAVVDIDGREAEKTAHQLLESGYESFAIHADVTKKDEVLHMVEKVVLRWGRLDIGVNNAGKCLNAPGEEMGEDQWDDVVNLNLKGVFLSCQAAGRVMISQKAGSIINIASMSARIVNHPQPQVAYNASKAGVIMVTRSLAAEWAPHGVRVNSISPGYTATELTLRMGDLFPKWVEMTPMRRLAQPDEMKGAAVYLASEASRFVTGHDLVIDGGFTLW
ncbi:MAG: SDR family oxidoreductase [Deltaproteobacteria bacterium]|nr:SDR family oxidoreductase [Deltaproteobacteria bacterium]